MKLTPAQALALAIDEAYTGWGRVSPNPLVGCVVLNLEGHLIGKGAHLRYGGPHAEINAIQGLAPKTLRGAHVFVTLEPCAHVGQTPACAVTLAKLPIASVTYGTLDPFPKVSGKGIEILANSNKIVNFIPEMEEACKELAEIFLYHVQNKKPFVSIKAAVTKEGYISTGNASSTWITSELSRQYVHYLRAGYDAIVVGRKTIEIDNPNLNIRLQGFEDIKNKVVILDPKGKLLSNLKNKNVFKVHNPNDIIVVVEKGIGAGSGITTLEIPLKNGVFDLDILLTELYEMGICSLFVEGGAQTFDQFIEQKAVQRVYIFESQAPLSVPEGTARINQNEIKSKLSNIKRMEFDKDLFFTGKF